MEFAGEVKEGKAGNEDPRCPWPIEEVTRAASTIDDDQLAARILAYADATPIFCDRFRITASDGAEALQQRGRDVLIRCYMEIERACNPFLPAMDGARRRGIQRRLGLVLVGWTSVWFSQLPPARRLGKR